MTMSRRVFNTNKGTYNFYSNDEKLQLAELVAEEKEEYDTEVAWMRGKLDTTIKERSMLPSQLLEDTKQKEFESFILTLQK